MSGWNDSDRKSRLPSNWASEIVPFIKKRDKGQCRWRLPQSGKRCPRPGTDVDHKVPGDNHSYDNLWLLCAKHHENKTVREGRAASRAKKASRYRKPEDHPGRVR
jgi:5-methylcytosine-specific restriction protein A